MFQILIPRPSAARKAARALLARFADERVFAFYGAMGAGKTTLIKAICRELGTADSITSPTFALINEYTTANQSVIYHFDFYRIKKIEEAFDLGYEDYLYSGNYCLIEWPEMIEPLLPDGIVEVRIQEQKNGVRQVDAKKL
jgi:tRNA threonylcarbamoyladenosine biosynthesis protein TsaE